MLTEEQCRMIENSLTTESEPRKVAAYLCLHMGLMLSEVAALRLRDVDIRNGTVDVRLLAARSADGEPALIPADMPRLLPMPPHVRRYMRERAALYRSQDCFILSGDIVPPPIHLMQNVLSSVNRRSAVGDTLSAMDLRNAFIRRCIQSGMDLYSLCAYIGVRQPNVIVRRFGEYFSPRYDAILSLERFGAGADRPAAGRMGMNLLILGAGSQGPVEREIAKDLGVFSTIAFLDDDDSNRLSIGPLSDYERLRHIYPAAIPSFGNSRLRREYFDRLLGAGYAIPRLIHPSASISGSNVRLGEGVVIEPKVIIGNDVTVGDNVILSAGCVLDRECVIEDDSHVGCACTVTRGSRVERGLRVPAGTVFDNSDRT